MTQDFREKDIGLQTKISAVSGLKDSRTGEYQINIGMDPFMYPVDTRAVSGSITPDTSGAYNLGAFNIPYAVIYADEIVKTDQIVAATDTLVNVYGLSGIKFDSTNNKIGIATSGFLHESGVGIGRRHIWTHDLQMAGGSSRSDGIFTVNTSGTLSNPNDNARYCTQFTTAATAGAVAGYGALVSQSLRLQDYLSLRFDFRLISSGSAQLWMGFMNLNPRNSGMTNVGSDSRFRYFGLRFTDGGAYWLGSASTGAGETTMIGAPTFPADRNWHDVHIWTNGGTGYITIDNSGLWSFATSSLPASGSKLGVLIQISPTSNTAVSFRSSYMNIRANSPNPLGVNL